MGEPEFGKRTICDSHATHLLEAGYDIRTVQQLHYHKDDTTSKISSPVPNQVSKAAKSPVHNVWGRKRSV